MTTQALERAIKAAEQEIDKVEMVLTNPAALRRMQAERVVRAVLMAVREPDEAMSTAGFHSLPGVGDPEREDSNAIWTAMIDAILNDGEGE